MNKKDKAPQMINLLRTIQRNVPFFEKTIPACIHQDNLNSDVVSELFSCLPIIDKQKIKKNILQFVDKSLSSNNYKDIIDLEKNYKKEYQYDVNGKKLYVEYTSGTNGSPFLSIKTLGERLALGREIWNLRSQFSSVKADRFFNFIHNFGEKRYPFPFAPLPDKEERISKEIAFLANSNYSWWHINVYQLEKYYQYILGKPTVFKNLQVIENNGSYISALEKQNYAQQFNCKVADHYGCREVWTVAYDCNCGYLHVNEKSIFLELIDDDGQVINEFNKIGEVVVTSFNQYFMPFVRYKIGDLAYYVPGVCPCGRKSPRIAIVPGRNVIIGTNILGNILFRRVVLRLVLEGINKFGSISVTQIEKNIFVVNVRENKECREELEKKFTKICSKMLGSTNYKYIFSYNNDFFPKSIFEVRKIGENDRRKQ